MPRIAEGDGDLAMNTCENAVLDGLEAIENDLIEAAARA